MPYRTANVIASDIPAWVSNPWTNASQFACNRYCTQLCLKVTRERPLKYNRQNCNWCCCCCCCCCSCSQHWRRQTPRVYCVTSQSRNVSLCLLVLVQEYLLNKGNCIMCFLYVYWVQFCSIFSQITNMSMIYH